MNRVAIIQTRMKSTRLPKKVMKDIKGKPLIEHLVNRLSLSKYIDKIVVATTTDSSNDILVNFLKDINIDVFRGSEKDVLDRYVSAAKFYDADIIIRITSDCPVIDSDIVDKCINKFCKNSYDYLVTKNFPDGLDTEVCTYEALKLANNSTKSNYDREHVTPYINNPKKFKVGYLENNIDLSKIRWTVDEQCDLDVVKNIFNDFKSTYFKWTEILDLYNKKPELFKANMHITNNEGAYLGEGQKLWKRAKQIIPGGNMLLSKRSELYLPNQWPSYFSKTKKCFIWDLDGKKYIDMSLMGVGTNTLGYSHPEVDEAVMKNIKKGNLSTLNCPEEVYLAERLIDIHPWAEMVRFCRAGGEANAIAIRIARAASGKDNVAICGYHGWHDWYLSANIGNKKNLDNHLLPGLNPQGVPENLKDTVFPFKYNDFDSVEEVVKKNDIGVIKMEVVRSFKPSNNFIKKVRELATRKNIILIFDECTSGFRESFGGIHKNYNVDPDIAIFGKTLGNGYAINAVIGKKSIMEAAQTTFISSTFWTERVGPTAALKTLEVMQKIQSWEIITNIGLKVRENWKKISQFHNVPITIYGIPALSGFTFDDDDTKILETLFTQEMLKKGYLAGTFLYTCTEHKSYVLESYFTAVDEVFTLIKKNKENTNIIDLLEGPVAHSSFKRIN